MDAAVGGEGTVHVGVGGGGGGRIITRTQTPFKYYEF